MQPTGTLCRCGHLLECCADCQGWLAQHSARIAFNIEWWYIQALEMGKDPAATWGSDAAEADDLAYYLNWRWSQGV
jgi:hypothetical protein